MPPASEQLHSNLYENVHNYLDIFIFRCACAGHGGLGNDKTPRGTWIPIHYDPPITAFTPGAGYAAPPTPPSAPPPASDPG